MFFTIDPKNGLALYEQIVRQVKFAVAEDTLKSGQLLPSVRVLSQQLAVNPNTLNRAFQQLQQEGILETVRGRGLAVCNGVKQKCAKSRHALLSKRFRTGIEEAIQAGLSKTEIKTMIEQQLEAVSDSQQAEN